MSKAKLTENGFVRLPAGCVREISERNQTDFVYKWKITGNTSGSGIETVRSLFKNDIIELLSEMVRHSSTNE